MNKWPFEQSTYKQYQNTFLASVLVEMAFPPVQDKVIDSCSDAWGKYVEAMFGMKPIDGIFQRPIVVSRGDKKLSFCFENGRAQVHINGDGYQNFADSVIPHAYKLKQFITDVALRNSLSMVGIRKIDIFQMEPTNKEKVHEGHIRSLCFSKEYADLKENRVELDVEEQKMPGMVKHQWQDREKILTIRSVFLKASKDDGKCQLVLDTEELHKGRVGFDQLDIELKKMNMDLFNAYMWCVSDKVKIIMESGKD